MWQTRTFFGFPPALMVGFVAITGTGVSDRAAGQWNHLEEQQMGQDTLMEQATTADGASISFTRQGRGDPVPFAPQVFTGIVESLLLSLSLDRGPRRVTTPLVTPKERHTNEDRIHRADSVRHVANHVADPHMREIPGADHFGPHTEPEAVASQLIQFFTSAQQPARREA